MTITRRYRLVAGTAVAVAGAIGTPAVAAPLQDDHPWSVTAPTPQPGPLNPQALPDGRSVSTATVPAAPGPAAWTTTDLRPAPLAAPVPPAAATPSARRAIRKPVTPAATRVRRIAQDQPERPGTWRVVHGETLGEIAALNRTTPGAIVRANRARHPQITPDYVQAGWRLAIPTGVR
jgi:hypothetical protein